MKVKVLEVRPNPKPAILASVRLELATAEGDTIVIDDARALRRKSGEVGVATPCYSVPGTGKAYEYRPAIVFSVKLRRDVEDAFVATMG